MEILFDKSGIPHKPDHIKRIVQSFPNSYGTTVHKVIENTLSHIDRSIFFENVSRLLSNFKMTRGGPLKGIKYLNDGNTLDPQNIIAKCWGKIGDDLINLKRMIKLQNITKRGRILIEVSPTTRDSIVSDLDKAFLKLLPVCAGVVSEGRVGASKILFAVLPEIAQPIDNAQWDKVFKTKNYGDIISHMANEIIEWEKQTGEQLESCDPYLCTTLPSVYNVMAMEARPKKVANKRNEQEGGHQTFDLRSEALVNLLYMKGIISEQELLEEVKKLQATLPKSERVKG
jgi:hypothetical protein